MTPAPSARPVPVATPETAHYWDGTARGELLLQRCHACTTTYFPPQAFCPACSSDDVDIVRAAGTGTLHSYVITHLAAPGFEAPYVLAVVELDDRSHDARRDAQRDKVLTSCGYRVIRFHSGRRPDPRQIQETVFRLQ